MQSTPTPTETKKEPAAQTKKEVPAGPDPNEVLTSFTHF